MADTIRTPIGLSSFCHLFTPRPPAQGAEPRHSLNILFDKEAQNTPEYAALKKAAADAIAEKWGTNPPKGLRSPFRDAGEKGYEGYEDGVIYINAWSKQKPGIVDARLQDVLVPDDVFPGQLVRATVSSFAYDKSGNRGVAFSLQNVQICKKDMPRLDGKRAAKSDFDALDTDGGEGNDGDFDGGDPFDR